MLTNEPISNSNSKTNSIYFSKLNLNHKKKITILTNSNGEGCHYLEVKKLSALLRGINLKNNDDCYCLNCLYSFRTKSKLESHKTVCKNKGFYGIVMPSKDTKVFWSLINAKILITHNLLFMKI